MHYPTLNLGIVWKPVRLPKWIIKLMRPYVIRRWYRKCVLTCFEIIGREWEGSTDISGIVGYNWDMVFEYYTHK